MRIKNMLSNKNNIQLDPKIGRQLNPIQLKKTIITRTSINCYNSPINDSNKLKNEYEDIYEFLKDLNMESYLEKFIKNGINTKEKLLYLNNDNLKLINIPYAHRARFLKKLKEIEIMQLMKKTITEKGVLSKLKVKKLEKNSKYEEIYIPKEEDDIEIGGEQQSKIFEQALLNYQKSHNKFDNKDNIIFFRTGLNNMTNNIDKNKSQTKISNRYFEINQIKKNEIGKENKNFDDKDYKCKNSEGIEKNIDPIDIEENTENKDLIIKKFNNPIDQTSEFPKMFFPLYKSKTFCYNCFHIILEEHCIQKFKKPFCSLLCLEKFEKNNVINCSCCEKKIEKINSIPSNLNEKIYYCSSECLQKKEPNENLIYNKSQIMEQNNFSPATSEASENNIDILDL